MKQFITALALILTVNFPSAVCQAECTPQKPSAAQEIRFESHPIDDATFARMQGRSYKADCTLPREELRYLILSHYDFDGQIQIGEMVCNRAIANDLLEIFRSLFEIRYPIASMKLIDDFEADDYRSMEANNSSAFNFRMVRDTGRLSKHSFGYAVDINPLYNPYIYTQKGRTVVEPETAKPWVDRSRSFPGKIDHNDPCYKAFIQHGFIWGGDWKTLKDYQHFEKPMSRQ